jgi:DNA primase
MELYPEFRASVEIKEIDDTSAKELFIALEECFQHGESGIDALLIRIRDEPLRNFIVSHGDSPEFKIEAHQQMEDGINNIEKKKLNKRLTEIGAEIRNIERGNIKDINDNIEELLAEKKIIDSRIRKIVEKTKEK